MKRPFRRIRLLCLALVSSLVLLPGCDPFDAVWFGLGALWASQFQSTTVEVRCYQEGVQVDCSQLSNPPVSTIQ